MYSYINSNSKHTLKNIFIYLKDMITISNQIMVIDIATCNGVLKWFFLDKINMKKLIK